jgi:hypothetical protein
VVRGFTLTYQCLDCQEPFHDGAVPVWFGYRVVCRACHRARLERSLRRRLHDAADLVFMGLMILTMGCFFALLWAPGFHDPAVRRAGLVALVASISFWVLVLGGSALAGRWFCC